MLLPIDDGGTLIIVDHGFGMEEIYGSMELIPNVFNQFISEIFWGI